MMLANAPQDPEYNGLSACAIVTVTVEPADGALAIVPSADWQAESDAQGTPFTDVEIVIPV
ncbi:hypothetical protein [Burkholderia territorii]|uniref:hypothetical protein n=1 Tax=Burkholderia territorii TaxID=1503055 RepID=UPI001E429DD8|nr:hypothetical protein [Burkholderia territorii]